ncbi:MAG: hypothetical protein JWL70_2632 [Acidimicrobiia bacterium]|nr:hypothetical protein [Acidimicrobiia bacterium]
MAVEVNEDATDRPYPARRGRLPRHLEEVTPQWLTSILANRYPGVVVNDFETMEVKSSHTTKLRIAMDLNEAGQAAGIPSQVCLKSNWSKGIPTGDICEMEARFYFMMAHELDVPLPKSYYADWDGDGGGRGVVMMEDLAAADGEFGSASDHLGVDGIAKGLESLALLHGKLWGSDRLDAQTWLPGNMNTVTDTEQVVQLYNYLIFNMENPAYRAVVPDWVYEAPEKLNFILDELSAYEQSGPGPYCLVHGDAHQGNSFLRGDGERVWNDWQLVRKGTPWRDVNYFIIGGLTVEERRASDSDLLEHYRQALIGTGARDVPSHAEAWEQFRRWPAYGIQSWLSNVSKWGQSGVEMVKRSYAAAEDYDTVELLTAGKTPRRQPKLGEGASTISDKLRQSISGA